jgi:hypothetical protein
MEGDACDNAETYSTLSLTFPVHVYPNVTPECAVTGGFVYRGTEILGRQGVCIFGDFYSGKVWELQQNGDAWDNQLRTHTALRISILGENEQGKSLSGRHGRRGYLPLIQGHLHFSSAHY